MVYALLRYCHLNCLPQWSASIKIPIILWECARSDLQPDAMPGFEDLGSVPTID
jgi:hypothetical protein